MPINKIRLGQLLERIRDNRSLSSVESKIEAFMSGELDLRTYFDIDDDGVITAAFLGIGGADSRVRDFLSRLLA